ncbi:MAG: hypothetical protein MJZ76_07060 [Bacteroidales bacterium]|nr:hypothetical protein [Bacteroidales bacterium]
MKKKIKLFAISLIVLLLAASFTSNAQQVKVGIVTTGKIAKDSKRAEQANAVVSNDVFHDGKVIIAAGTPVQLDVKYEKRRGIGRPAHIEVTPISTTDVNGQIVILNGSVKTDDGKNKRGAAVGCGVVFGILLFPVGLLFLCIKGGHASVPAGSQLVATAVLN